MKLLDRYLQDPPGGIKLNAELLATIYASYDWVFIFFWRSWVNSTPTRGNDELPIMSLASSNGVRPFKNRFFGTTLFNACACAYSQESPNTSYNIQDCHMASRRVLRRTSAMAYRRSERPEEFEECTCTRRRRQ